MTPEAIAKAREIIAAATPGPWKDDVTDSYGIDWHIDGPPCEDLRSRKGGYLPVAESMRSGDAEFCAAARTGWAEALDEVEFLAKVRAGQAETIKELRAEVERLRGLGDEILDKRIIWIKENVDLHAENERLSRHNAELIAAHESDTETLLVTLRERDKLRAENERRQISVGKLNDAGWEANAEIEKLRDVAEAAWQAVSWLPNMEPIANTPRDTEHNRSAWALRQALKTWRGE